MNTSAAPFDSNLSAVAAETEATLDRLLSAATLDSASARPERLLESMRYASLGGGKRIRPFLVVAGAEMFGVPRRQSLMVGAALELVHCYSLVHDDLPQMDNDDLRRGRPTTHRAFDEATAILVGDALLTLAFDVIARAEVSASAMVRLELVQALARASGLCGMAGGQMLDLAAEGRFSDGRPLALDEPAILALQAMKTGALLKFASAAGAIMGAASPDERAALDHYGEIIGQAFQIADDILDIESDSSALGKAAQKDAHAGKATLIGVIGAAAAKARLSGLVAEAETTLRRFGAKAATLIEAAKFIAIRRS